MAKRKGEKKKRIPQKTILIPERETSSSLIVHPNATLTPDASLETQTTGQWLSRDSTNAPKIGEESEEQERYAGSQAALIDKYILSRHSVPFVLAIIVIGYIFIQDNGAGKLTNWEGIWWAVQKSGILAGIICVLLIFQYLYKKIF
jgi:hypothetical protein